MKNVQANLIVKSGFKYPDGSVTITCETNWVIFRETGTISFDQIPKYV